MLPHQYRNFGYGHDRVDTEDLVAYISREVNRQDAFLSDSDIRKFIDELHDDLNAGGALEIALAARFRRNLAKDLDSARNQGLYRSRNRFLVFCYAARRYNSPDLSRGLNRFFSANLAEIMISEQPYLKALWYLGVEQLRSAAADDKAFRRMASRDTPVFEEWRRSGPDRSWGAELIRLFQDTTHECDHGRTQTQIISSVVPRYPTTPPLRHRKMYNSSLLDPAHEMQTLQLQQQIQALDVAKLKRDVDDLQWYHR
ncbi:hypothetical protein C7974DRAFT_413219 [Boeremia exigua]|uniref:uncharacterized protein n=1 Tax=Boeremia exigua TaxID=749465 RepID=UPI001E8E2841|nr:uncharacterized protein C7974DRAFT_413219 [Boeremia exigua]KAH6629419.1 hypothetical protein C7974DRAFT_413219 [Boeremia exigua]